MNANMDHLRERIELELDKLGDRHDRITAHLRAAAPADWEEAAVERENDEVLEALDEGGKRRLTLLRAALGRIHDGSYGRCVECDVDIPAARLDALPHTPWCVDCAESHGA